MIRKNPTLFILAVSLLIFTLSSKNAWSEGESASDLTIEQKQEKRLLFNQYVEDEIARREKEKYKNKQEEQKKTWISKVSSVYGYDSNVNLNSSHRGDGFFQETMEGSFKIDRPSIPAIASAGRLGVNWYNEFYEYENTETLSYQTSSISVFTEEKINPKLKLKLAYEFSNLRYYHNDQLNYYGHKAKPTFTYYFSDHLSVNFYTSYEYRDYISRKALDNANGPSGEGRVDGYYELGIGPRFYPTDKTYIGGTLALKWNDSNDAFHQYNDYDGWKANGFIYQKLNDRFSTVALAGYDYKNYASRTFQADSAETEEDRLFYLGDNLYYDFNKNWQVFCSYVYKQNDCNDPLLEFSGYTMSAGVNFTF